MDHPSCGFVIVLLLAVGVISIGEGLPTRHTNVELPTLTTYESSHPHHHSGNDYGPELHITSSVYQLDKPKQEIGHEVWLKDSLDDVLQYLPIAEHHGTLLSWPLDHIDESVFSKDSHGSVLQLIPYDLHDAHQIHQNPSGNIDTKFLKSYG